MSAPRIADMLSVLALGVPIPVATQAIRAHYAPEGEVTIRECHRHRHFTACAVSPWLEDSTLEAPTWRVRVSRVHGHLRVEGVRR